MEYKHLTEEERYQIDDLRREGFNQKQIAKKIRRSPSTLSRELHRNEGERGWRPRQAQLKAQERLVVRGINNARKVSEEAWRYAEKHLTDDQWSPQQISGHAKLDGIEGISHETIYQRILEDKNASGNLYTHLRCKKKRKKRYGSARSMRVGANKNRAISANQM
jgi:transposase, IS30 family